MRRAPRGLGHLGHGELLEPEVRAVTAERFDVPERWLQPEVSFEQDLAADARDLAGLVVSIEARVGVTIPGMVLDRIHTYGDLVDAVVAARMASEPEEMPSLLLRADVTPGRGCGRATISRAVWLSPYALETIASDARRAGAGARLDVVVPATAPWAVVPRVEACLLPLARAGVVVSVRHAELPRGRAVA